MSAVEVAQLDTNYGPHFTQVAELLCAPVDNLLDKHRIFVSQTSTELLGCRKSAESLRKSMDLCRTNLASLQRQAERVARSADK